MALVFIERRFLFFIIVSLSAINVWFHIPTGLPSKGRDLVFSGIVIGEDHHENYAKLSINIDKTLLKNDTIDYRIPVQFYTYSRQIFLGRRLLIKGSIRPAKFLHRPNILVGDIVGMSPAQNPFNKIFYTTKKYIDNLLRFLFKGEHYKIASGLILGGSNRLGKDLKEVFSRAGVIHILAVSGLHVGFVCLFIGLVFLFLPISSKMKFIVVMFILFVYVGVTGFRPSICRAALMAFLFGLALILQRNVDGIHIINITAIIFLLTNPLLLFDVGAQLSFVAVYGIIFLYPQIEHRVIRKIKNRFLKIIFTPMAVSFSAQLFVSPLLIYYFHRLPTLAVFSNLIIVPIAATTIFLIFLCLLSGLVIIPIAKVIAFPVSLLLTILIAVSRFFAGIPFSSITLSISPIFLILFFFIFPKSLRRFAVYTIFLIAIIFSISSFSNCAVIKIAKDGTLISMPSGENIFVTLKEKTRLLSLQGLDELDYLIAPQRLYPVRKDFYELPQDFYAKKIRLGEMAIELRQKTKIIYRDQTINLNEYSLDKGNLLYIITDGKKSYNFTTALYNSIVDQMITDVKVIFAKLRFLF